MEFRFRERSLVRPKEGYPDTDVSDESTGIVWCLYELHAPAYEVTFQGRDGKHFDAVMYEDELVACEI